MPELPEVETVRRGLTPILKDRVLARVEVRQPMLRWPVPSGFAQALTGRRIADLGRRAKYLLVFLDDGQVVIVHLGMSGSLAVRPDGPPDPHDHIIIETDAGVRVTYHDPRRFGSLHLTTAAALADHPLFAHLGPEPLDNAFDGPALAARLAGKRCSIKAALLDQRVVAGLGNIYVCESLFHAGLSPRRLAGTVTGARAARLVAAIRRVLLAALESGGSTLRDHRQPNGELGYFQHTFSVYGKAGEPCPGCDCDGARTGAIRRIIQNGRSTFFCARRQR